MTPAVCGQIWYYWLCAFVDSREGGTDPPIYAPGPCLSFDDDINYYIGERLKLEGETESNGV